MKWSSWLCFARLNKKYYNSISRQSGIVHKDKAMRQIHFGEELFFLFNSWLVAALAHSIHSFPFSSALPNELKEEKNRIDGLEGPLRIENELNWINLMNEQWSKGGGANQQTQFLFQFHQLRCCWWNEKKCVCWVSEPPNNFTSFLFFINIQSTNPSFTKTKSCLLNGVELNWISWLKRRKEVCCLLVWIEKIL